MVHLIRKGVALAGGLNPVGINFGDWLLREMRALIHAVATIRIFRWYPLRLDGDLPRHYP